MERSSGILAHPSSFPGRYGIGDLGPAAYQFVDFLYEAGQNLWQLLPLNPTGFGDSPYQSFSTFAWNPLLISPELLLEAGLLTETHVADTPAFPPNAVEYGDVIKYKNTLLRDAYKIFPDLSEDPPEFRAFDAANSFWLDGYALFMALKQHFIQERNGAGETAEYRAFAKAHADCYDVNQINDLYYGAAWQSWPEDIAGRKENAVRRYSSMLKDEMRFQKFQQYIFHGQWTRLKAYTNALGIHIIGDIPIFVALDSADCWCERELFLMDEGGRPSSVAGVPPDYFSETGQLWGNPLYDWPKHREQNYAWWVRRVAHTLGTVDIVRIDHFRGFESYWAVPFGEKTAIKGRWMKGPGAEPFAAMRDKLGSLPVIAEDLGDITEAVDELREELELPGMRVLQFGFGGGRKSPHLPHNFTSANIVVYTGTHDNDTALGWYDGADERARDHFRRYMNVSGEDAAWDIIRLALFSCADMAVIPIQDLLSLNRKARMNIPATAGGNWRFRYTEGMLTGDIADRLERLCALSERNHVRDAQISEVLIPRLKRGLRRQN